MKTWVCDLGQKLEIFTPFVGRCRPVVGRCCQTCAPQSWDRFSREQFSSLGFRNVLRVTEESTRYRGWLARRLCCVLAVCAWEVPTETPPDAAERICRSRRVQDVPAAPLRRRDGALRILAEIQAPLSVFLLRLCAWALLRVLGRLFRSVQLQRGQLETVLRAARAPGAPLVFLSVHKSRLDGLLLWLLLFSQGLGVPRVTVSGAACSPRLRALLRRLGAVFLPERAPHRELAAAVLTAFVAEVLRSRQPLLVFLEEPGARSLQPSAAARAWLAPVLRACRDGAVPDALLVPVGIAYDAAPGAGADGALGIGACLRALLGAWRRRLGCVRVDFAQPFSLQEFVAQTLGRRSRAEPPLEELLLPDILGTCVPSPGQAGDKEQGWDAGAGAAGDSEEEEEEGLVAALALHALSDAVACCAVPATALTAALLLHRHGQGVLLSRLMGDFSWLLEEVLLRDRDAAFSGPLRAAVPHGLAPLAARLALYRLSPPGDVLVLPGASAAARRELGAHCAALLPVFAGEAVGACALRALLLETLPAAPLLRQDELLRKSLALLRLLPAGLLGIQPCQPLERYSQDVLDRLVRCGLLEAEEPEHEQQLRNGTRRPCPRRPLWSEVAFAESDSDDEAAAAPRCFKLCQPPGAPDFLLLLCRLLSPVLRSYVRAAAFLEQPRWPRPEPEYAAALQQFLAEDGATDAACPGLALSSLQTFKEMGVLRAAPGPAGPLLELGPAFRTRENRRKLQLFIQQFLEP